MILHGVHYRRFDIKQEDTLERPLHMGMTLKVHLIVSIFSRSMECQPYPSIDDCFSQYGKLAPSSKDTLPLYNI